MAGVGAEIQLVSPAKRPVRPHLRETKLKNVRTDLEARSNDLGEQSGDVTSRARDLRFGSTEMSVWLPKMPQQQGEVSNQRHKVFDASEELLGGRLIPVCVPGEIRIGNG